MAREPRPDVATELLESWINGNRNTVRALLSAKRGANALRILTRMLALCDEDGDQATRTDLIAAFSRD